MPKRSTTRTEEAENLIRAENLGEVLSAIEVILAELRAEGAPIAEVTVECELDPEIEGRPIVAITAWLRSAPARKASAAWSSLRERFGGYLDTLPAAERDRIVQRVAVGVDVE